MSRNAAGRYIYQTLGAILFIMGVLVWVFNVNMPDPLMNGITIAAFGLAYIGFGLAQSSKK